MIEIVGKYNVAKVFTDNMEHEAYNQIKELCDMKFAKDSKDSHNAGRTYGYWVYNRHHHDN